MAVTTASGMFQFLNMSCLLRINGLPWEFSFSFFGLINIFFFY